jgi:thymidine kinase
MYKYIKQSIRFFNSKNIKSNYFPNFSSFHNDQYKLKEFDRRIPIVINRRIQKPYIDPKLNFFGNVYPDFKLKDTLLPLNYIYLVQGKTNSGKRTAVLSNLEGVEGVHIEICKNTSNVFDKFICLFFDPSFMIQELITNNENQRKKLFHYILSKYQETHNKCVTIVLSNCNRQNLSKDQIGFLCHLIRRKLLQLVIISDDQNYYQYLENINTKSSTGIFRYPRPRFSYPDTKMFCHKLFLNTNGRIDYRYLITYINVFGPTFDQIIKMKLYDHYWNENNSEQFNHVINTEIEYYHKLLITTISNIASNKNLELFICKYYVIKISAPSFINEFIYSVFNAMYLKSPFIDIRSMTCNAYLQKEYLAILTVNLKSVFEKHLSSKDPYLFAGFTDAIYVTYRILNYLEEQQIIEIIDDSIIYRNGKLCHIKHPLVRWHNLIYSYIVTTRIFNTIHL